MLILDNHSYKGVVTMNYQAHIIGGVASAVGICYVKNKYNMPIPVNDISFFIATGIGALLPDIDHPDSFLGREVQIVGSIIRHRTITHSIMFAAVLGLIGMFFSVPAGIGLFIGILSHLLLDMIDMNSNGVCLLAPFSYEKIGGKPRRNRR